VKCILKIWEQRSKNERLKKGGNKARANIAIYLLKGTEHKVNYEALAREARIIVKNKSSVTF
jgi:hypothetical protein